MLIFCDKLFILITTVHRCFLSKKKLPGYWPFCPCLLFTCFYRQTCSCGMLASYARSTFLLRLWSEKTTPYRNFLRNLNFKNIVNFFKRTCWYIYICSIMYVIILYIYIYIHIYIYIYILYIIYIVYFILYIYIYIYIYI